MKLFPALALAFTALPLAAQSPAPPVAEAAAVEAPAPLAPLRDAELVTWRRELLNVAFLSASAMPLEPHIKNRSRAQEAVIEACIELDQFATARRFVDEVANWRRGACLAELAHAFALQGDAGRVAELVDLAAESIDDTDDDMAQGWRRDRLRTKIARALLASGDADGAALWTGDAGDAEVARVAAEAARTMDALAAREYVDVIAEIASKTLFDQLMGTLEIAADLHARHYAHAELRGELEEAIKASWELMPIGVRITLLADLADGASAAGDFDNAGRLLDEATKLESGYPWGQMRNHLPIVARLAHSRALAEDVEGARVELGRGLAVFEAGAGATPDVFQARALRPLAEAAVRAGDAKLATELYTKTLEVGLHNPNSRPRAEDLAATATSMATAGYEPSPELWGALRDALGSLADPW